MNLIFKDVSVHVADYISVLQGKPMQTKKLAKRAVALEACMRLHKMGELNERLLPRSQQETLLTCSELFPLFKEVEMDNGPRPGTKKRKQSYLKEVSLLFDLLEALSHLLPQYHCRIFPLLQDLQ
jgi:hypothetical protein